MVKHSDLCYKVTNNISHVQHINAASLVFVPQNRRAPRRLTDVPQVGCPTWGTSI